MTNKTNKTNNKKEIFKKVFTILSGLAFVFFSVSAVVKMVLNPQTPSTATENNQTVSLEEERLKKELEGYQLVLEKEPDNRFALEKLVQIQLQLGNLKEALPLMERLIKIEPENERYQEALALIKQGIEQQNQLTNSPNNPNPNPNSQSPNTTNP